MLGRPKPDRAAATGAPQETALSERRGRGHGIFRTVNSAEGGRNSAWLSHLRYRFKSCLGILEIHERSRLKQGSHVLPDRGVARFQNELAGSGIAHRLRRW